METNFYVRSSYIHKHKVLMRNYKYMNMRNYSEKKQTNNNKT